MFQPLPTPGSSGGPIIDEESGAVVGVVVGTRMDSEIDGLRGWGRPAETIFEVRIYSVTETFDLTFVNRCSVCQGSDLERNECFCLSWLLNDRVLPVL